MKHNIHHILSTAVALTLVSSCGIPNKIEKKNIESLPERLEIEESNVGVTHTPLSVDKFFQDPLLIDLIEQAIQYNYDLKSSEHRIQMAMAYYQQSKGALLPSLMAEIFGSGQRYGKYTIDGVGNFDTNLSSNIEEGQKINTNFSPNYLLGLSAQWEIDLWGKLGSIKKSNLHQYLSTIEGERLLKSAIITQIAIYYYDLIAMDQELEILQSNLLLQEDAYRIVQLQKKVGKATELAVQQFKAQIAKTNALTRQKIHDREERKIALLNLIGKTNGDIPRAKNLNAHGLVAILNIDNPQYLIENRPDIQQNYQQLLSHYELAKAARAAFFPKLAIGASAGFNAFNSQFLFNPASIVYSVLGNLTAPIFSQNQLKSNFNIANAEHEIAFLNYQNSIVVAYNEVRTVAHFLKQNEQIKMYHQEVVAAQETSIHIANNLYTTGYASYLEVINAQKEKLESDLNLLQSQHKEVLATIHLFKTLGGGWK